MRKLAQASTALLLSGASTAMAAGIDSSFGEARLYWRTTFGERAHQPLGMQYGATLDYDRRYLESDLPQIVAAHVSFDQKGFAGAAINGVPFARRVTLQQDEGASEAGSSYTVIDYSLLAIGAAAIGFAIYEVADGKNTQDAATPGTPPGNPPAQPPSGPSIPGLPGLPGLPGAPGGTPSLPSLPGLPGLSGGTAGAFSSFAERTVTPEYQEWLDAGTGGMGDLVLIKE